jgi:small-conductance mechanosensitive channel
MMVPPRNRDWYVGFSALALAVASVIVGRNVGKIHSHATHLVILAWVCAVVLVVAGALAIRRLTSSLGRFITHRSYPAAGAVVRLVGTGVSFVVLLFALFAILGVSLQHLLIGAGLAGVVLGIAAQQSLANIFAALVLLFARPFNVGDHIRIRSGTLGVLDVEVLGIGLTYVTVRTEDGSLKVPNSAMLASGIGHLEVPPANDTKAT